jgi:MtN3 and saliva related transmembrane protein
MKEALGWLSSLILLATIGKQVHEQWVSGRYEGVSRWLFVGQVIASAGFTLYSALLRNWVFVVTNGALFGSAVAGWAIYARNRRRKRSGTPARPTSQAPGSPGARVVRASA